MIVDNVAAVGLSEDARLLARIQCRERGHVCNVLHCTFKESAVGDNRDIWSVNRNQWWRAGSEANNALTVETVDEIKIKGACTPSKITGHVAATEAIECIVIVVDSSSDSSKLLLFKNPVDNTGRRDV